MANYLLNQLLKTVSSTESDPYNYHPRHPTKDPEYKWSGERMKRFKSEIPAPDVNYFNAPGDQPPQAQHDAERGEEEQDAQRGVDEELFHAVQPRRSPPATYSGGVLKFLLVVALVAVAIYLVVRAAQRGTLRPSRSAPKPQPRAIAPDDDEDFLRDLDRRKVHGEDEDPDSPTR